MCIDCILVVWYDVGMSQVLNRSRRRPDAKTGDAELLVVDRVEGELRKIITTSGARLPQERDLADQFGVRRQSVRHAIARLKKERLLRSVRGKGTFVVSKSPRVTTVHLITNATNTVYGLTFVGVISDVLREQGLLAHVISVNTLDQVAHMGLDASHSLGAILVGPFSRQAISDLVKSSSFPIVHVSDMEEKVRTPPVCDTVLSDNAALGYQATEYLIRQGHRRIAMVGWGPFMVWDHELYRGLCDALRCHGIEPDPTWSVRLATEHDPEGTKALGIQARRQIDEWFQRNQVPTGLVYYGDDELRAREGLCEVFGDLFAPQAMVAVLSLEILQNTFRGRTDAVAVTCRFRDLATRAIELLDRRRREPGPPTREFHGRVFLVRRRDGIWREETPT